jgi:hypothetical protein
LEQVNSVALQEWTLADATPGRHLISSDPLMLAPESLLVLAGSPEMQNYFQVPGDKVVVLSSWPTLNATGDSVRLFDATGRAIACSYYRGSWGQTGFSLERKNPRILPLEAQNWAASEAVAGATPGRLIHNCYPTAH